MKKTSRWCALIALLLGLFAPIPLAAQGHGGYPTRPGEVIIKFKPNANAHDHGAILTDLGATQVSHLPPGRGEHLRITKFSVDQAIARYRRHPKVEFIEPNYVYRIVTTPNDPEFSRLWGLSNTGQDGGLPGADIDATLAWDVFTGSDVLVAITDTGIDYTHPDLAANVFANPGEIAGNGIDDDNNGFIDDVRGWDFVNHDNDPRDDHFHGTHVSGTVGAIGDNGIGVVGVNWHVKILPLKFLDAGGSGSTADAVSAIDYAVSMGARVISASWGGGGPSEDLRLAIAAADSAGVLFVAAAGNSAQDNDVFPNYPSNFDLPNVIAVAATDRFDRLAFFSNYGATTVDLAAPGQDVYSTMPGGYGLLSGTSMATPHVSGVLALILGRFPGMSGADAKALLLSKVDVLPSLVGRVATGGRLNAFMPIAEPDSLPPGAISDLQAVEPNGTRVTLHWSATGDDGAVGIASRYEVRYSTAPITEANFGSALLAAGAPRPDSAGSAEQMGVRNLVFLTTYHFAVKAFDEFGNASPISNVASATTLGPPDIAVTPGSLQADLLTGETTTRLLTVTNTGVAELNLRVAIEAGAAAASAAASMPKVRTFAIPAASSAPSAETAVAPSYPVSTTAYAAGHTAPRPVFGLDSIRVTNILSGSLRILLLHTGDVSEIRPLLAGFPDIAVVDEYNARAGTPTLAQLLAYDAVIVGANFPFADVVAMGDVLADYVDSGGGVVLTLASFISGWAPQGRFQSGGYSPFPPGSGPIAPSVLGSFDAAHPIMAGVTAATGQLLGDVSLSSGAVQVASWANGEPMVATKGLHVAAVNIFVVSPGFWTGDIPLILHNAAFWTTGATAWLSAAPDTAIVPAGGQIGVVATFDATDLDGGDYENRIVFSSDDPDEGEVSVPAQLHVTGAPDIHLEGEPVVVESKVDYTTDGAQTTHRLAVTAPVGPGIAGSLELVADGDYGDSFERATATAESTTVGSVGSTGIDCSAAMGTFPLSAAQLAVLVADGVVEVSVQNTFDVNVFCATNRHTVRLRYGRAADRLDFGSLFVGQSRELALTVRNRGSAPLEVTIASDRAEFTPGATAMTVAPRTAQRLAVTFHPGSPTGYVGTLRLQSNDADQPLISVALEGTGLNPPIVGVQPSSLTSTLNEGNEETQTLRILNSGLSPLEFSLDVVPSAIGAMVVHFAGLSQLVAGASNNPAPSTSPPTLRSSEVPEPRFKAADAELGLRQSSPLPLTSMVGDPSAGFIYAQANQGTAFYRYRATNDTWERLADAPLFSSNNGGAALLNGRIYTTYTQNGFEIGIYDIATNSWSRAAHPLGAGTANIASDGSQYLYLALGTRLVRYTPSTGDVMDLAPAPFFYEPWGALQHLSGKLYGHQGNGTSGFATYDVTTNTWTPLPPVPGGAVAGAAIDPSTRDYFAYGSYGGNNLYQFSIAAGTWSVSTIPFFPVNDGGLAWLSGASRGVYFAQGEQGSGFARFFESPDFLTVSPSTGVVPPLGAVDVGVRFATDDLLGGTYQANIQVASNDPVTPLLQVPASLTVIGAPNIHVEGEPALVESMVDYLSDGAVTTHRLAVTAPVGAATTGSVELIADGDYGDSFESATAIAEGMPLGSVGSTGIDCSAAAGTFSLSAAQLGTLVADGVVEVRVQNSFDVNAFCTINRHTVRLRYGGAGDRLDFGSLFVGQSRELALTVRNLGSAPLEVTIASDRAEFTPGATAMTVAPRTAQRLAVTFQPGSAGVYAGTLRLQSNDADQPLVSVALAGTGLVPPDIAVTPPALDASLFTGETATQTLTIQNTGESDLTFSVGVVNPTANAQHNGHEREMIDVGQVTKGELDARRGNPVIAGRGGPDAFGYRWRDSHEPGGPTFDWVEIAGTGTAVPYSGDDWNFGPIPIGFSFPFYDQSFNTFRVCSNGFISFTSPSAQFGNQPLPSPFAPENLLAAFWADLYTTDGSVLYRNDGTRLIVEYRGVTYLGGSTPFTFEILLYPSGRVVYQYLNMGGTQTRGTVGLQNAAMNDGLTIAFNAPYAQDGLAVEIAAVPEWLSVAPDSGTVPAGGHLDLAVRFDAAGLLGGDYLKNVVITNNDPDESQVSVPAHLHVTGAPDIALSRSAIDFGTLFVGAARPETVVVSNAGTDLLTVTEITASRSEYQADLAAGFSLTPGASRPVIVTFRPGAAGPAPGTLTVRSNDPDEADAQVALAGNGLIPPDIAVTPSSLNEALFACQTSTRTLTIANTGPSDLVWSVETLERPSGARVVSSSPTFSSTGSGAPSKQVMTQPAGRPAQNVWIEAATASAGRGPQTASGARLEDVLAALDANYGAVIGAIPNRFDFFEGEAGVEIFDGGNDMYDGGNFLSTDLGGPIDYSNGAIRTGSWFGAEGRYFTRKYPGLFVLAAEMRDVNAFTISGNLGADGSGNVDGAILEAQVRGVRYRGFVKRVYNAFDPSVNHLVIVEDDTSTTHEFVTNTDDDYHRVLGLGSSRRIFYVLYAGAGGGYIDNAATLGIMTAFLEALDIGPEWLGAQPQSGTVPGGGHSDVTVTFNAADLIGGDYIADVLVTSNDPDEAEVRVPAQLHVTGAPDIVLSPSALDFGTLFIGAARAESLIVTNRCTDVLSVSEIVPSSADYTTDAGTAFTVAPGASRTVMVTFRPSAVGPRPATLMVRSNDPDAAELVVPLAGAGLIPPDVAVAPPALDASLLTGAVTTQTLTIQNTGGSDLFFAVTPGARPPGTIPPDSGVVSGPDVQYSTGDPLSVGGQHPVGNTLPLVLAVPRQHVNAGTVLVIADGGTEGDVSAVLNGAGYGVTQVVDDAIWDGTNPSPSGFRTVVLLDGVDYGDDMPSGGQQALMNYVSHGGGLIITEWIAFEVESGRYTSMQPLIPMTRTTGVYGLYTYDVAQNHPVTAGVSSSFSVLAGSSPGYANSGTTLVTKRDDGSSAVVVKEFGEGRIVQFAIAGNFEGGRPFTEPDMQRLLVNGADWTSRGAWLSVAPDSGTVPAGGHLDLAVRFDAVGLLGGDYYQNVVITNNDPDESEVSVPAHLHVTGAPDIALSRSAIDFGTVFLGGARPETVAVSNAGVELLTVTEITTSRGEYQTDAAAAFSLAPGASRPVIVTFRPEVVGPAPGTLTVRSNDPDEAEVQVALAGAALIPPDIALAPLAIAEDLLVGQTSVRPLRISNDGGAPLTVDLAIRLPAIDVAAVPGATRAQGVTAATTMSAAEKSLYRERYRARAQTGAPIEPVPSSTAGIGVARAAVGAAAAALPPGAFVLFSDDMEGGTGGWLHYATDSSSGDHWGRTTARSSSGSWSWQVSQHPFQGSDALQSPSIDLAGVLDATLSIRHWYNFDDCGSPDFEPDGAIVEISSDGGANWQQVDPYGGYPYVLDDICFNPLAYRNAYSHSSGSGAFVSATFDLTPFVGHSILLRFHAGWDCGNCAINEGWYVDDVVVYAQGPKWVSVSPVTATIDPHTTSAVNLTFNATGLAVGSHDAQLLVRSNDPDEPSLVVPVNLQVADVGAVVNLDPNALNLGRRGNWVTAYLELPPPFDLGSIVWSTLRLNRASPADPTKHTIGDQDLDGIPDVTLKFDQDLLTPTLPEGDEVGVTLTGEIAGDHRMVATGIIRVMRHHVVAPNGGETLTPGTSCQVRWSLPSGWEPHHADAYLSVNGGVSWSLIAAGVSGTSFNWVVPNIASQSALVRVDLFDALGAITHDSSDQPFSITSVATAVEMPVAGGSHRLLQNAPNPFRSSASTTISFHLPRSATVRLAIYDAEGHLVHVLADGWMSAGRHQAIWQGVDRRGRPVPSGVYFYQLREGNVRLTKRMVVLR